MRRVLLLLASILAALGVAGCFNPFSPVILSERVTTVAPRPTTPQNAVKLFEWCWKNRGVEEYKELFTSDYVFLSAGLDSAGNPSRVIQARRDDEIQTAENMFIGSSDRPPASRITLSFDPNLVPFPDPRPGYVDTLFKTIRTSVALTVAISESETFEITGYALFYLVRGDTAAIPAELIARGFTKDRNRWWISRWEDETLEGSGVTASGIRRARPAGASGYSTQVTMAELKRYYLAQAFSTALANHASVAGPSAPASARVAGPGTAREP